MIQRNQKLDLTTKGFRTVISMLRSANIRSTSFFRIISNFFSTCISKMLHNIKNLDQDYHYGAKNNNYSLNGWEKEKRVEKMVVHSLGKHINAKIKTIENKLFFFGGWEGLLYERILSDIEILGTA